MWLSDSFFYKIPHFFCQKHLTNFRKNVTLRTLVNKVFISLPAEMIYYIFFRLEVIFCYLLIASVIPTTKTLLLKIFVNIILIQMRLPILHEILLNVFGHWICLTRMNLCVIDTLNSVLLPEHLPVCSVLTFCPLTLMLLHN